MSEFSKCLFLVNTNTQTEAKTKEISWVKALKNVPLAATWWSFGFQCDESTETLSQQLAMSNGHRRQCVESCGIKTWLWLVWLLATGKLPTGVFTFKCFTMFYHPRFDYLGYPMASPTHLELLQCWSGFPWLRRFFSNLVAQKPELTALGRWLHNWLTSRKNWALLIEKMIPRRLGGWGDPHWYRVVYSSG